MNQMLQPIYQWFKAKKWQPWKFQEEAWQQILAGKNGLISVPTGAGKTYAAYLGPLAEIHNSEEDGLQLLYITPLRSLTRDIEHALKLPIEDLGWKIKVESRTGDTSFHQKMKQKKKIPHILLTTPESLSILQADPTHKDFFKNLKYVIVDEWHELMGTKRGVLLTLSLAHLRPFLPRLKVWGMSATIANLEEAAHIIGGKEAVIIKAAIERPVIMDSVLPAHAKSMPWAGFSGLPLLDYVLPHLDDCTSTLVFTNTRSQAERWFQALVLAKPEWQKKIGLHHSSIDKKERIKVEEGIKDGSYSIVVCTSSLDLGVDFPLVKRVIQIGSCKSVARLIQRAGRSSHQPMTPCHIILVPTHALEIVEILALRQALEKNAIETRAPLKMCYDVLFQHLVTLAIGGGFQKEQAYKEAATSYAFADLTRKEFDDILQHLVHGGSLEAYPDFHKLVEEDGLYHVKDRSISLRHRMNIGTITSDTHVTLQLLRGKPIGSIEESFLASLKPKESFSFGGKVYELVQLANLTAIVRLSRSKDVRAPIWQGSRLPFSPSLADAVRGIIHQFSLPHTDLTKEERLFEEICTIQNKYSLLPSIGQCLVEITKTKEGWHHFFYPFEGSIAHEALASLLSYRLAKDIKTTIYTATTDYGFELLSSKKLDFDASKIKEAFSLENLEEDLSSSVNVTELAKARFRDIARIGGFIFSGYPSKKKSQRQLQMSSSLLFDIFLKYEPDHLLLKQAFAEVMQENFQMERLTQALKRLSQSEIILKETKVLTPLAVPLYASSLSGQLSSESLKERVLAMTQNWNK